MHWLLEMCRWFYHQDALRAEVAALKKLTATHTTQIKALQMTDTNQQAEIDAAVAELDKISGALPTIGTELTNLVAMLAAIQPGVPVDTTALAAAVASADAALAAVTAISVPAPPAPVA